MNLKLSICIPTINRSEYIGQTLSGILDQVNEKNFDKIEIIIIDASINDSTREVVNQYLINKLNIKYFKSRDFNISISKKGTNLGFDVDCDRAVQMASAKYCWLFTDDDIIKPGIIDKILSTLDDDPELVVINSEIWDNKLNYKVVDNILPTVNKEFGFESYQNFFCFCISYMSFVGAIVIKRSIWKEANKEKHFGTGLIHLGVIFGERVYEKILFLGDPGIKIRSGNALWDDRAFEIGMINWPNMINSLGAISIENRNKFNYTRITDLIISLLIYRAKGLYNLKIYSQKIRKSKQKRKIIYLLVALIPRKLLHRLIVNVIKLFFPGKKLSLYELLRYA